MQEYTLSRKIMNSINNCKDHSNFTLIIYGSQILSIATPNDAGSRDNYITRKARTTKLYYSRHCEVVALSASSVRKKILKKRKVKNIWIINFRKDKDGNIVNGCCCLACCKTFESFGIDKIVFSNDYGQFIKTKISEIKTFAKYSQSNRLNSANSICTKTTS